MSTGQTICKNLATVERMTEVHQRSSLPGTERQKKLSKEHASSYLHTGAKAFQEISAFVFDRKSRESV